MAILLPSVRGPRRPRPAPPRRRRCLVVSGDPGLRSLVEDAAASRGWNCIAPADAASLATSGTRFPLVFVDLVRPPVGADGSADRLTAAFAADHETRLVVCGAPDRPEEELWARQLGAIVYVPGIDVGPGFRALVRALCR